MLHTFRQCNLKHLNRSPLPLLIMTFVIVMCTPNDEDCTSNTIKTHCERVVLVLQLSHDPIELEAVKMPRYHSTQLALFDQPSPTEETFITKIPSSLNVSTIHQYKHLPFTVFVNRISSFSVQQIILANSFTTFNNHWLMKQSANLLHRLW